MKKSKIVSIPTIPNLVTTKQQYYKVVDMTHGHYGLFYHVGVNKDPKAKSLVDLGSCDPGAIYFVTADELHNWVGKGKHIAWVEPISPVQKDTSKYRAHEINITKILPVADALHLIPGIGHSDYQAFGVHMPKKMFMSFKRSVTEKAEYLYDTQDKEFRDFCVQNRKNARLRKWLKDHVTWTQKDVEYFIKVNVPEFIDEEAVREIAWSRKVSLIEKLIVKYPKLLAKIIVDMET